MKCEESEKYCELCLSKAKHSMEAFEGIFIELCDKCYFETIN